MISFALAAFGFIRNSWVGQAAIILGGALLAVLMVFAAGKRAARKDQRISNLENYADVQKRIHKTAEETARLVGAMSDDELNDSLRKHPGAFRE